MKFQVKSNIALSYSKRLSRPGDVFRSYSNVSSNIALEVTDLDPSLTDKFDIGYINRWDKVTLNTSMYFENTVDVFSFVRYESGEFVDRSRCSWRSNTTYWYSVILSTLSSGKSKDSALNLL
jgi:outer membrane receptor protein involved in Fe transport